MSHANFHIPATIMDVEMKGACYCVRRHVFFQRRGTLFEEGNWNGQEVVYTARIFGGI